MKIVAFNGSPRAERSNTHVMVKAFLDGARLAGAETENVFLAHKKVHPCCGCLACWIKTPGKCAIKDDMAELMPKLWAADLVVFATPLYVDNVTGIMKNFMDRLVPSADPYFERDAGGECRHKIAGKVPKIAVIANSGFPEQSHFQVLKLFFKRVARNMSTEVAAEIYRGGGAVLSDHSFWLWFPIRRYRGLLRRAGEEVARAGKISPDLQTELEKPLIPEDQYISAANAHWKKELQMLRPQNEVRP